MNQSKPLLRTLLSLAILGIGIGGFFMMGKPDVPTRPPDPPQAPVVETIVAEEHQDGIEFEVDGVVVPFRQINIAAQVNGRVGFKSDQCRTGRAVKKGDLLIRIEQEDYELEVKRLNEEVAQADAMVRELEAEVETTDNQIAASEKQLEIDLRQLKRLEDLVNRSAASKSELDTAKRAELDARNELQKLRDQKNLLTRRKVRLESAKLLQKANLDKAQLAFQRTEILAPWDGVVVSESVEQGGYLQTGNTIITLQDTSQLDVTCKLHMRQMHWLWQGQNPAHEDTSNDDQDLSVAYDFPDTPATVTYELGGKQYQWEGIANRYDGAGLDNQTRMIPCRIHVADPLGATANETDQKSESIAPPTLMTGMFVRVRIHAKPPIPLVRLPAESIQPGNRVWTVADGKLKRKNVLIASPGEDFVVARQQENGLQAGDVVVVSPMATPIDGLDVQLESEATAETKPRKEWNR